MRKEPWYRSDPNALAAAVQEALKVQEHLRFLDEGERVFLRGRFDIREADEAFAVEIQMPIQSPRHLPVVWEIGERIPRVADPHHANNLNGSLCVQLEEAYWYHFPRGLSTAEFLEGPLRAHLAGQISVLRGDGWPAGEWGHGWKGRVEFYSEVLETKDPAVLYRLLRTACEPFTKTHLPCPCGSGRKTRKCHGPRLHKLGSAQSFAWVRERWSELELRVDQFPEE